MVAKVDASEESVALARLGQARGWFGGRVHQDSRIMAEDSGQDLLELNVLDFAEFKRGFCEELGGRIVPSPPRLGIGSSSYNRSQLVGSGHIHWMKSHKRAGSRRMVCSTP